ncbi:MAG: twitching motility protein PilT [Clostridiales bacterium]|nr:twitching motility protein PilT [Clostridiales bacterium]
MVQLIVGGKGAGKTKRIIEMANEQVESTTGHVVFIDDDMRHSFDIHHDIRLMNMEEFSIKNSDEFFGFICGIASTDYDIETIYIDGLVKIIDLSYDELSDYIEKMENMCENYDISFVITLAYEVEDLPENLKEKVI